MRVRAVQGGETSAADLNVCENGAFPEYVQTCSAGWNGKHKHVYVSKEERGLGPIISDE